MGGVDIQKPDSGLGTEQELRRRVALATPADTVRGLSFDTLLDVVRLELGNEGLERCLDSSVEKSFKSFFSYPVQDYLRLLYASAWELQARYGTFDNSVRRISLGIAPGFLGSVVGRAFMLVTREGPRQLINHMPSAHRAMASFGELSVQWKGPRSGVLSIRHDFLLPMNHEGGLLGFFRTLGLRGGQVHGRMVGPLDNEMEFSWE